MSTQLVNSISTANTVNSMSEAASLKLGKNNAVLPSIYSQRFNMYNEADQRFVGRGGGTSGLPLLKEGYEYVRLPNGQFMAIQKKRVVGGEGVMTASEYKDFVKDREAEIENENENDDDDVDNEDNEDMKEKLSEFDNNNDNDLDSDDENFRSMILKKPNSILQKKIN